MAQSINYRSKTTWLILFFVFLLGASLASSEKKECKEKVKTVEVEKPVVTKIVEKVDDRETWLELKRIDDDLFILSSQGFTYASEAVEALTLEDWDRLASIVKEIENINKQVNILGEERKRIIQKLNIEDSTHLK